MKNATQLSLLVAEDVPEKLAHLAGTSLPPGHFLTQLIRILYDLQASANGRLELEHLLDQLPILVDRHKEDQEIIRNLRSRLHKLTTTQAELMAVNHLLVDAIPEFGTSALNQPLH